MPAPAPPAFKGFRTGTHRAISPERTLARVRPLMPIMGITRIADVTGLDIIGVPVVMVFRPNASSLSVTQGKGLSLDAARASGVMEAIEAYHAENILLPLKLASYDDLRFSHRMADIGALPRLAGGDFHADRRMLWIEGHDLLAGEPAWVPFETVSLNFTLPLTGHSGSFLASSRGLASGNHLLEAMSHGICELVEHDATTLWGYRSTGERQRRRLDLDTVDDPGCREVLDKLAAAGVEVAAWDMTTDVEIAAFHCTIADRSPAPLRPMYHASGMGCHPAREIALLRALTEAAQSRLTFIAGARDDIHPRIYAAARDPQVMARVLAEMRAPGPLRSFAEAPSFAGESFEEDVAGALERLRAVGIGQVVVVDLTRPELRIPVARVLIPGLESLSDTPGHLPGQRARRAMKERTT
jgi:YcaO-like protein with predicted kinase domain